MECEELRRVPETTEKQKLEHVLRTRIDTVWSPFRLKPCPGSNPSATEWRRKSFPHSFSVFSQADVARGFRAYNASLTPVPLQSLSVCRFREAPSVEAHFLLYSLLSTGWVSGILLWIHCTEGLHSPSSDLCVTPRCGHIKLLGVALAGV